MAWYGESVATNFSVISVARNCARTGVNWPSRDLRSELRKIPWLSELRGIERCDQGKMACFLSLEGI